LNDEAWGAVCDSLKTHPTLQVLDLLVTVRYTHGEPPAPAVTNSRIQALVDVLKVNTTIHTIRVESCCSEHDIYRESVIPYLEMNQFQPRLLAIQKTRPITYRAKTSAASMMATLTSTATGSFTTAATAAATSAAIPSTTSAAIPSPASASDAFASTPTVTAATAATAATNVATPSIGQKRKACPYCYQGLINSIEVRWGVLIPDAGTLAYAKSEHDETHRTYVSSS
jgi:hypothetical protein